MQHAKIFNCKFSYQSCLHSIFYAFEYCITKLIWVRY